MRLCGPDRCITSGAPGAAVATVQYTEQARDLLRRHHNQCSPDATWHVCQDCLRLTAALEAEHELAWVTIVHWHGPGTA